MHGYKAEIKQICTHSEYSDLRSYRVESRKRRIWRRLMGMFFLSGGRVSQSAGARMLSGGEYDANRCNTKQEYKPNPDPTTYKILYVWESTFNNWLLIKIKYEGNQHYEGIKLLLYKDITLEELIEQGSIDPHFSDSKKYISPVARFEPTDFGLRMALKVMSIK